MSPLFYAAGISTPVLTSQERTVSNTDTRAHMRCASAPKSGAKIIKNFELYKFIYEIFLRIFLFTEICRF